MTEISRDLEPCPQDNTVSIHADEDLETNIGDNTSDTTTKHIDCTSYNFTYSSPDQTCPIDPFSSLDNFLCCGEGSCSDATIHNDTSSSLHHIGHHGTRSSQGYSFYNDTQSCFEDTFYDDSHSSLESAFLHNVSSSPSDSSNILNYYGAAGDSISVLQWPSRGPATGADIPSSIISETADSADLSREELLTKIGHTLRGIQIQEEYIQRQEAKKQRNKEMIAELEAIIEAKKANVKRLQTECAECESETTNYETEREYFKQETANSSMRHFMGKKLYDDLLQQKDELETERDEIRGKLNKHRIPDHVIDDFIKNKGSLDCEKGKKQILHKNIYEKKTAGYDVMGDTLVSGPDCLAELFAVSTKVITPQSSQEEIFRPLNSQFDEAGGDGFKLCFEPEFPDALDTSDAFLSDESI